MLCVTSLTLKIAIPVDSVETAISGGTSFLELPSELDADMFFWDEMRLAIRSPKMVRLYSVRR